jgi:hypothetical protein
VQILGIGPATHLSKKNPAIEALDQSLAVEVAQKIGLAEALALLRLRA